MQMLTTNPTAQAFHGSYQNEDLVSHILASDQLVQLINANKIDIEHLVVQILATDQLQQLIKANKINIEDLVIQILATNKIQQFFTANEINIEDLVVQILATDKIQQLILANKFDIDDLVIQILATNKIQQLITAIKINIEDLVIQILATGQLQQLIKANKIDIETVTRSVLTSDQMRQFLDDRTELDGKMLVAKVLDSEELRILRRSVDSLQIMIASGRPNDNEMNTAQLVTRVTDSAEWRSLIDEMRCTKESADAHLHAELVEQNRLLSEQRNAIDEMSAKLQHIASRNDALHREQAKQLEQIRLLKERQYQMSRTCCSKVVLEALVARTLATQFGDETLLEPGAMKRWMQSLYVAKDELDARLANLTRHNDQRAEEVWTLSSSTLMAAVSDKISEQMSLLQSRQSTAFDGSVSGVSSDQVRAIVSEVLTKYDADKTGMVDHALESSGGEIISTRCTETYHRNSASITLFGIPLWRQSNNPRSVIQPGVHPGECWAFRGSQGSLVIKLAGLVRLTSFSLEHIPQSLAFAGNIDSAPKDFSVLGLDILNDPEPIELGRFTYKQNSTGLQHFPVMYNDLPPYRIVELKIESNHGNLHYTCVYRFRVHGTWVST